MSTDSESRKFSIALELASLRRDALAASNIFDEIAKSAENGGTLIDRAMGARLSGTFQQLKKELNETLGAMGNDSYSAVDKLRIAISTQEQVLSNAIIRWKDFKEAAESAQTEEDFKEAISGLKEYEQKIRETSQELERLQAAKDAATVLSGGTLTQQVDAPMLFMGKADYDEAEKLRQKISELKDEIAGLQGADLPVDQVEKEFAELTVKIVDAEGALAKIEGRAVEAASALGADLGTQASEVSQRFYELTDRVKKQEEEVGRLSKELGEAKAAYENFKNEGSLSNDELVFHTSKVTELRNELQNATNQLNNLRAAQRDAGAEWNRVSAEVDQHDSKLVKMLGGYENYQAMLGKLPGPLQSVITGITGMTGAARMFIATPLGAIIGAIVIALQALKTWFDSSSEGQMAFAKISGYVSGVLTQLKEIVISAGEAIYKAFTDPKKAISDLWEALKNNLLNRVKAAGNIFVHFGEVIGNAFELNFDAAKDALKSMGNDFLQLNTGVENLADKALAYAKNVNEAAKATSKLAAQERQLNRDRSHWEIEDAKLTTKINEARNKMLTGKSAAERKKATEEAMALIDQQYAKKEEFARRELEIIKERNSLSTNADEDYENEYKAEAALERIAAERAQAKSRFLRGANTADNAMAREAKSAAELALLKRKNAIEEERAAYDLQMAVEEAKIAAMEDGSEKALQALSFQHKQEQEALKRKQEDMLQMLRENAVNEAKKRGDNTFDPETIQLTEAQSEAFESIRRSLKEKQERELKEYTQREADAMNEFLKEFGTYAEKRQALINIANEKLLKAETEGERRSISAQLVRDLSELDIEANKKTASVSKLFEDMTEKTVADMRKISLQGKKALSFLTGGEWNTQTGLELGMTKETFDTLRKSPEELERIRKALKELDREIYETESGFKKLSDGLKEIFKAGEDTKKFQKALGKISEGVQTINQLSGLLKDSLGQLGEAFGSDLMSDIAEGLNVATDAMNGAMQGAQAGAVFGPWGAAAGAAIGVVSSLGAALSKLHDAKHEKKISQLQDQIAVLKDSYEVLGNSIEKAYSKDAKRLIEQQNELLKQQKLIIQQQINEEKKKKNSDSDRIKDWEKQIKDIEKQIADNKQQAIDAIFGEDIQTAINNFASAYESMFDGGFSKARASKDLVKQMIKQMIVEAMKSDISQPMEKLRQMMMEFWSDGYVSQMEQNSLNSFAQQMMAELEDRYGWADSYFKGTSSQSSSKGGFTTMSQDSADELNGRFTALQMAAEVVKVSVIEINEQIRVMAAKNMITSAAVEEIRGLTLMVVDHLDAIRKHTSNLKEMNDRLAKIEKYTSRI